MTENKIKIAIIGASGFTGAELVRILLGHAKADIIYLAAESNAGKEMSDLYAELKNVKLPTLIKTDEVDWGNVDVVFCCLPHATSQDLIATIPESVKVIDLSADFRIKDPTVYEEWYQTPYTQLELQKEAVYGLSEIKREQIKNARLVACPGCYPTSILLPLIPLVNAGLVNLDSIIVNSVSGVSGAGAKAPQLLEEIEGAMKAYGVEGHRHLAEVEQELGATISFTPNVIPSHRGIVSNINFELAEGKTIEDVKTALLGSYSEESFVNVLINGVVPSTISVNNTNEAEIAVFEDRVKGRVKIISAIDNLIKGASGQAVQNMNIMYGLEETEGVGHIK